MGNHHHQELKWTEMNQLLSRDSCQVALQPGSGHFTHSKKRFPCCPCLNLGAQCITIKGLNCEVGTGVTNLGVSETVKAKQTRARSLNTDDICMLSDFLKTQDPLNKFSLKKTAYV